MRALGLASGVCGIVGRPKRHNPLGVGLDLGLMGALKASGRRSLSRLTVMWLSQRSRVSVMLGQL